MNVEVRLPLPDEQVFRYAAMDDMLEILARNPSEEFSNRNLQRLTGYGGPSVSKALSLLVAMELLVRRDTGIGRSIESMSSGYATLTIQFSRFHNRSFENR